MRPVRLDAVGENLHVVSYFVVRCLSLSALSCFGCHMPSQGIWSCRRESNRREEKYLGLTLLGRSNTSLPLTRNMMVAITRSSTGSPRSELSISPVRARVRALRYKRKRLGDRYRPSTDGPAGQVWETPDLPFCAFGISQLRVLTLLGTSTIPSKLMLPHRCNLILSLVGMIKK
jgi:hypothetical protein